MARMRGSPRSALASPEIVARGKDGTWTVDVGAGTVTLPGTNVVEHGQFTLEIKEEGASVSDLQLALRDPAVKARLSASWCSSFA